MKDLIKKHRKIYTLVAVMLIVLFMVTGILVIKNNLEEIVKYTLTKTLNYNISIKSINISKYGTIVGKGVVLRDKNENIVLEAPIIKLRYSLREILKGTYLTEISAVKPIVYLTIYEKSKVNIMDALNLNEKKESTKESSPLKYLKVSEGILYYRDISYKKPINMKLSGLKGYIDLDGKFKLWFEGHDFDDKSQIYGFGINEIKKDKLDFKVMLKNVDVRDELLQYAYDDLDTIDYKGGKADLNLNFGASGLGGNAFINNGIIKYKYIAEDLKKAQVTVNFDKDKVDIFAKAYAGIDKVNFELNINGKYLGLFFDTSNMAIDRLLKNFPKNSFYKNFDGTIDKLKGQLIFEDIKKSKPSLEIFAQSKGISYLEHEFKNIDAKIDFDFNKFKFDFKKLDFEYLNEMNKDYKVSLKGKAKGTFEKDKFNLEYNLDNKKSFFTNKNFNGKFMYDLKKEYLEVKNANKIYPFDLSYNLKTTDFKLKGNFIEDIVFSTESLKTTSFNGNIDLDYNIDKEEFNKANGNMKISNELYFKDLRVKFRSEGNNIVVDSFDVNRGESSLKGTATIHSKTLEYNGEITEAKINSKDFTAFKDGPEFQMKTNVTFKGKEKDVTLEYKAEIEKFIYGAKLEKSSLHGNIEYIGGKIKGTSEGYVKNLNFKDFIFRDLYVDLTFDNNEIVIREIKNANVFIKGNYRISSKRLDFLYELNDYNLSRVKADKYKITGLIGNMNGEIKGDLNNPSITMNLKNSYINYNNTENAKIEGSLVFKDSVVNLKEFYFKENRLMGIINIKDKTLNLKANLLESKLNSYYKDNNVKYRVIGALSIWGNFDDLRAVAQVNLDNIYYRGKKIPDLFVKMSYINGDINKLMNTGRLNLTELEFLGESGYNIVEAEGFLDFATKKFQIKLGNENVVIKDIEYLVNDYKISGKLNLNFEAEGFLNGKLNYKLDVTSTGLTYNNIVIDKIDGNLVGNEKELKVNYLNMTYGNNNLNAEGDFNLEKNEYDFSVKAVDLDLEILNLFLSDKVKNITGKANIDMSLKSNVNKGNIEFINAGFSILDNTLNFDSLNSSINLDKDGVKINSFTGKLNNGTISIDGYLKIPELTEELLANPKSALKDYNVNLLFDNVDYNYNKTAMLNFDADLNFTNNFLLGNVLINKGEILKLPSLSAEKGESKPIGISASIEINTLEGVYFSADNIPLVEDIELKIEGGGTLEIKNGKINFIGKMIAEDGALTFNNSIFEVDSGIIIFDGINEYFPNVNPSLAIKAQTTIANEQIYITLSGYYDALSLDLQSSSGLSTQDITSLLLFKSNAANSSVNSVVKDILDKQFSEEIFSPLSKELEKLLNISKVKISSKLLRLNQSELSLNPDILLGAEFELSDPLYKDKIYWNLKTTFSEVNSGEIDSFNLWFDYKINKSLAWKLGIERLKNTDNTDENNFHLGIDFKYQVDSIFNIK